MKMGYIEVDPFIKTVDSIGIGGFFIIITAFAVWVFYCFFTNLNASSQGGSMDHVDASTTKHAATC